MGLEPRHALSSLLADLAEQKVLDVDEETFGLFSNCTASNDLGMLDAHAATVQVCVAGQDLTLDQSPGILTSDRSGGTTGAVVWKASIPFANWISSPSNILFQRNVLHSSSTVLELGSGVGLVGLAMAPQLSRFILTDQDYMMKLLHKNIEQNTQPAPSAARSRKVRKDTSHYSAQPRSDPRLETLALDWETSDVADLARLLEPSRGAAESATKLGVDAVIACDCVFNEALVEPFVETCAGICELRCASGADDLTFCVIAQQLRSPDVFEFWLACMTQRFHVWRLSCLDESSGYVVHLAILRSQL